MHKVLTIGEILVEIVATTKAPASSHVRIERQEKLGRIKGDMMLGLLTKEEGDRRIAELLGETQ